MRVLGGIQADFSRKGWMKGSCLCWNMYVSLRERSMSSKSLVMSVSGWCGVGMYSRPFWRTVCCSGVRG